MPRFSIVTVTYNNLDGLKRTRETVREQTFRDFEWLVIDGGSADGTREAMQLWQSEIRCAISAPDQGPYDAMNKGLGLAQGEYVLFINAGDVLAAPDVLEKLNFAIGTNNLDFIYGDSLEEQVDGGAYYKTARHHGWRWWGMFASHQSMIYRTRFLKNFTPAYDLRYRVGADLDLAWRILKQTKKILRANFAISRCARAGISTQHAALARKDQVTMRHEHSRLPALINIGIMLMQQTIWNLRQRAPGIYNLYRLRRAAPIN
jgi:putative colanic acid biosynthesis glycosyltransferase